jgi:hypothetical protein
MKTYQLTLTFQFEGLDDPDGRQLAMSIVQNPDSIKRVLLDGHKLADINVAARLQEIYPHKAPRKIRFLEHE